VSDVMVVRGVIGAWLSVTMIDAGDAGEAGPELVCSTVNFDA
jgi:hypothetical protein